MSFMVSSSSSSPSSSNSSPNPSSPREERPYDVFLTSQIDCPTVSSLQTSFRDAAIKTYIDNDEVITSTILEAIEQSRFVIFVFTKDFGTSIECLDKLDKIMEFHRTKGKKVLLMFCGVRPLDVRQQISTIQELLIIKERQQPQDFFRWRTAATEALSLDGWIMSPNCSRYLKQIREITHSIKIALDATCLDIPPHLVGIQPRVKEVLNLTKYYSNDITVREENVIMVGIQGPGGIGKTTIARIIYDTISGNFESRSFLASIKNVWEEENGQCRLQEQLISDVSGAKSKKIHNAEVGIRKIKRVLPDRRAIIVLDDVDHKDQLMALCGSRQWFGFGSMILITSRKKNVFDHHKVRHVYKVKKLDKRESFDLFSKNAFKQSSPSHHFINLAKNVCAHCERLPLVLEVFGSFLSGRTAQEWDIVLKKLESIHGGQIKEKLKLSCSLLFYRTAQEWKIGLQKLKSTYESGMEEKLQICCDLDDPEIRKGVNRNNARPKYKYDVFLSFNGDDTRRSFTSHLYTALKKAGIVVFMDNRIRKGQEISSSLIQAIESSRISIIIFSVKYGGSRWCLQEEEKIMECHKTIGQNVLPIFYNLQPSDVRNQRGRFGNELKNLIKRIKASEVQQSSWKSALKEAADISGWDSQEYRNDAELIESVIKTVKAVLRCNKFKVMCRNFRVLGEIIKEA